ncbi:MAG: hypothetical protein ACOYOA_14535 [Saprospiraceae bacterium]
MSELKLDPLTIAIAEEINIVDRYRALCERFNDSNNRMTRIDKNEVMKILKPYWQSFKYFQGDYYIEEPYDEHLTFGTTIGTKGGNATCYLRIKKDGEFLKLDSGALHSIYRKMLGNELGSPIFYSSYVELSIIIKEFIAIYEDFKKVAIEIFA